jgi:hypothetical protein
VRACIAIAAREVAQRWVMLVVAAVLGWLPVAAKYVDNTTLLPIEVAPVLLYVIVRAFWMLALAIGMSLVGRQLHGGQLAFYFARPIAGWAIAGGKVLGAATAVVLAELLVLVPLRVGPFDPTWLEDVSGPDDLVAAVLFLGAGLVAGVLARSRSRWFAIDAIGLVSVALLAIRIVDQITTLRERYMVHYNGHWQRPWNLPTQPLGPFSELEKQAVLHAEQRFLGDVHALWGGVALAAAVALLAAAAAAVVVGRTDGERAHRAQSTTLWSSLFAIGTAGLAIAHWGVR